MLHVFRVAASLDSMILGEPQILGQVKDAFALAQSAGTVGPVLHALMSQAFGVAKKVRTETEVGRLAVSVSFAAVELARKIFGEPRGQGGAARRRGRDERARRPSPDRPGRASRVRRQPHLEPGPGAGAGVRGHRGAASRTSSPPWRSWTSSSPRRRRPSPSSAPPRCGQALARRAGSGRSSSSTSACPRNVEAARERPRQRVLLRHRRPALGGRGESARSASARRTGRSPSWSARSGASARASRSSRWCRRSCRSARSSRRSGAASSTARSAGCPAADEETRAGDGSAVAGDRQQGAAHAHRQAAGLVARRAWRARSIELDLGDLRALGTGPAA